MKSSKCLFNKAIFKSDFRRFLPFAIPLLVVDLIIFPVIIYACIHNGEFSMANNRMTLEDFAGFSIASDVFSFMFAGAFALLVFSYLYKANRCNAIHAFPIGRRGLFVTSFLAGYIMLVVPQIIGFAAAIPGIYTTSKVTMQIVVLQLVSIFAESFVFYCTGVLAVMLAGNIFAGAVIYMLINFIMYIIELVINIVLTRIGYGFTGLLNEFTFGRFSFSPFLEFETYKLAGVFTNADMVEETYYGEVIESFSSVFDAFYPRVIVCCVISVVLLVIAYILYKIRKLECAGDMTAFKIEIPIISVLVSFVGGSLFAMFVCLFIPFKIVGFFIAFAIFSFICFVIAQMILRKTPKIFNLRNMILWVVTCVIAVVGLYSVSVYKTNYIPKTANVKDVTVNASYDMEITDRDDIEFVEKFHKALIANEKQRKSKAEEEDYTFGEWLYDVESDYTNYTVTIAYTLENGKYISRTYGFDTKQKELAEMLYRLENKYHPETVFEMLEGIDFEIENVTATADYWLGDEYTSDSDPEFAKKDYQKIYDACKVYCVDQAKKYVTEPFDYSFMTDDYDDWDDGEPFEGYTNEDNEKDYEITFSCRVKTEKDLKKLNKLGYYTYDVLNTYIERDNDYWTTSRNVDFKMSDSFNIVIRNCNENSELFKMISAFDTSKSKA